MTSVSPAGQWQDDGYATQWASSDGVRGLLQLPWRMAAELTGLDGGPRRIVDVGSGPGDFLAVFLDTYPEAEGTWVDMSQGMMAQARDRLSRFGDRVRFVLADANHLAAADLGEGADVITNSRVAHHFNAAELARFYGDCAGLLSTGGWLVTLDHILPDGAWDARYRRLMPLFAGPGAGRPTHEHKWPFPAVGQHLDTMTAAGLAEAELVWKGFYTCLFMARKT